MTIHSESISGTDLQLKNVLGLALFADIDGGVVVVLVCQEVKHNIEKYRIRTTAIQIFLTNLPSYEICQPNDGRPSLGSPDATTRDKHLQLLARAKQEAERHWTHGKSAS